MPSLVFSYCCHWSIGPTDTREKEKGQPAGVQEAHNAASVRAVDHPAGVRHGQVARPIEAVPSAAGEVALLVVVVLRTLVVLHSLPVPQEAQRNAAAGASVPVELVPRVLDVHRSPPVPRERALSNAAKELSAPHELLALELVRQIAGLVKRKEAHKVIGLEPTKAESTTDAAVTEIGLLSRKFARSRRLVKSRETNHVERTTTTSFNSEDPIVIDRCARLPIVGLRSIEEEHGIFCNETTDATFIFMPVGGIAEFVEIFVTMFVMLFVTVD